MLNQNQVLASRHFVRRMKLFMQYLIRHQPLLCGKLTDYVIRYETQGRGSVHAHMLWWIDIDPKYIHDSDVIKLDRSLMLRFGLAVEKSERPDPNTVVDQFIGDQSSPPPTAPAAPPGTPAVPVGDCDRDSDESEETESDSESGSGSSAEEDAEGGGEQEENAPDAPRRPRRPKLKKLFNPLFLTCTNANIWAFDQPNNIRRKLHIGLPPIDSLSYVIVTSRKLCYKPGKKSSRRSGKRNSGTRTRIPP